MIRTGELEKAVETVRPYWPLPKHEIDLMVYSYNQQRGVLAERFGRSLGVDFLRTETIGDIFERHLYTERFERHAVVWFIVYYSNGSSWIVNQFGFTDQIETLFVPE